MDICEMEACKERYVFEYSWLLKNFDIAKFHGTFKYSTSSGDYYEIKRTTFKSHKGSYIWFLSLVGVGNSASFESWGEDDTTYSSSEFFIEVLCTNFCKILHEKNVEILIGNNNKVNVKGYLNSTENRKLIMLFNTEQSEGLVNDKGDLTIVFRIIEPFSNDIHTSEMYRLSCDFERLLKLGDHSDFKIILGNKEFLVHKSVLSSRSDYFAAMFKHRTKEQDCNKVDISDVRFEVMSELLQYIYCAIVNSTEDIMYDLLTAADMYQIDGLAEKCEESIIMHLKTQNVGVCMVYAERYDNDYLREASTDFLLRHASKFSEDDENQLKSHLETISSPFMTNLVCKMLTLL